MRYIYVFFYMKKIYKYGVFFEPEKNINEEENDEEQKWNHTNSTNNNYP